jgi:hypothetical protein
VACVVDDGSVGTCPASVLCAPDAVVVVVLLEARPGAESLTRMKTTAAMTVTVINTKAMVERRIVRWYRALRLLREC